MPLGFIFLLCIQVAQADVPLEISDWLQHLTFRVPYLSLPGPAVDIEGGNCTGLNIGNIATQVYDTDTFPDIGYRFSGIRLQCRLITHDKMTINFGLNDTMYEHRVSVQPFATKEPRMPLPMGSVGVTDCKLSGNLEYLDFGGDSVLSPMFHTLRNDIRDFIEREGPSIACNMMRGYVAKQATQILADQAALLVPLLGAAPPKSRPLAAAALVDWSVYPPVQMMRQLIMERPAALKQLIGLASPLEIPQFTRPVQQTIHTSAGTIKSHTRIHFVHVEGLETMLQESLRLGGEGTAINVAAAFQRVGVTIGMTVSLELVSGPVEAVRPLQETLNLTLDLHNLSFALNILAMVSKAAMDGLYVDQYQQPRCISQCAKQATVPWNDSLGMWQLASNLTPSLHIGFKPGTLEAQVADSIDTTVAAAVRGYLPAMQALIEGAVQGQRSQLNEAMWMSIESLPACGATSVYLGPGSLVTGALLASGLGLLVAGLVAALATALPFGEQAAQRSWFKLEAADRRGVRRGAPFGVDEDDEAERGVLAEHAVVPRAAVILFPAASASAMILFLYADVCLATSINFVFNANGQTLTIGPALAFSVVICAIDAFEAKAYLIAGCIAIMSILWPFVKLLLLLVAWHAPSDVLSFKSRDRLLIFLDEYGKWSLIDTWLGILALACYKLGWYSKSGSASFMVDPVPEMPFFMFVFASVMALVLGHVASGFHRSAAEWDEEAAGQHLEDDAGRRPLYRELALTTWVLLVMGLALTCALVLAGAYLDSFQMVESGALATLLLEPPEKITRYSLVSLGTSMTKGKSGDIGLVSVQIIFYIFALVIPVALQVSLLFLCLAPISHKAQRYTLDVCRALDAWAAFDVFTAAVTVSHFEFGLFSTFLMHYNNLAQGCNLVVEFLHEECFHMECNLTPGFAVLAVASVLAYGMPKVALTICRTALEERAGADKSSSASSHRLRDQLSEYDGEDSLDSED